MIAGHIGIAFAIRAARRDAPLAALLAASFVPDIADAVYATAHISSPYGIYSHSLPTIAVLAGAACGVAFGLTRSVGIGVAISMAILLHLPADWITGEKVLWAGGPVVGLVLYACPTVDFLVEVPILVFGWLLLRRDPLAPRWATAWLAFWLLVGGQAGADALKHFFDPQEPGPCLLSAPEQPVSPIRSTTPTAPAPPHRRAP